MKKEHVHLRSFSIIQQLSLFFIILKKTAKNPKHLQMQRNSECHRRRGEVENIVADYEIKVAKGNQKQFKTVYIAELQKNNR